MICLWELEMLVLKDDDNWVCERLQLMLWRHPYPKIRWQHTLARPETPIWFRHNTLRIEYGEIKWDSISYMYKYILCCIRARVCVCVCVQVCTSCRCVWVRTKIMKPCMILCVNMYSVDVLNQYSLNMPLYVVVWVSSRLHRLSHKLVRTWLGWDWRRTQTRAPSICEDCGEHKPTGNESIYWHHRYLMANRAAAMCRTVMHLGQ